MQKGSQVKLEKTSADIKKLVEEFTEKLKDDPFQPGIVHPDLYVDDIFEIIEDILWVRDHSEVTIRVVKNPETSGVSVEVLERLKA